MSLDRTLKTHGGLAKTRSVLSRAERIARLTDDDKFDMDEGNPLGLPKTRVRHSKAGTKSRKAEDKPAEGEAPVEGAEGGEAAPGAKD